MPALSDPFQNNGDTSITNDHLTSLFEQLLNSDKVNKIEINTIYSIYIWVTFNIIQNYGEFILYGFYSFFCYRPIL